MEESELSSEQKKALRDLGFNPDEFAAYLEITKKWQESNDSLLEAQAKVGLREALLLVGEMRSRAPSFLYSPSESFPSAPSGTICKVAGEACDALATVALNGDSRAAAQLAGLAAKLTEALDEIIRRSRDNQDFKGAKTKILGVASLLPYWPILFYSGADGEVSEIHNLLDEIGVGNSCPIDLRRRSKLGKKPSLQTPLNLLVWRTIALFHRYRQRSVEFDTRARIVSHIRSQIETDPFLEDNSFIQQLDKFFSDSARREYICERVPGKDEAAIVERAIILEELTAETTDIWALDVIFPELLRTEDLQTLPSFRNYWDKAASEEEFLSHVKQEIRRSLSRLVRATD